MLVQTVTLSLLETTLPCHLKAQAQEQADKLKPYSSAVWIEFVWHVTNPRRSPFRLNFFAEAIVQGLVAAEAIPANTLGAIKSPMLYHYKLPTTNKEFVVVRLANTPIFDGKPINRDNPVQRDEIIAIHDVPSCA